MGLELRARAAPAAFVDVGVRPPGVVEHFRIERVCVVRAEDGHLAIRHRGANEAFVHDHLRELCLAPAGPDGLSDEARGGARVGVDEAPHDCDDARRVAAQLAHVGKGDLLRSSFQQGLQQADPGSGHGDECGPPAARSFPHEPDDGADILFDAAIEEGVMYEPPSGGLDLVHTPVPVTGSTYPSRRDRRE
jgi:hypothetical protein